MRARYRRKSKRHTFGRRARRDCSLPSGLPRLRPRRPRRRRRRRWPLLGRRSAGQFFRVNITRARLIRRTPPTPSAGPQFRVGQI